MDKGGEAVMECWELECSKRCVYGLYIPLIRSS